MLVSAAFGVLALLAAAQPSLGLTIQDRAASPQVGEPLTNGARLKRGLPPLKPRNLYNGQSRLTHRATPSGAVASPYTATVCTAYDPSTFANSCSTGGNGNGGKCCNDNPGGLLLITQFWDTGAQSTGPADAWTLHGLWPDNCDGTYQEFCDASRERSDIRSILKNNGQDALLADMDVYWKDYKGQDETFWSHEWNKHGTCISSLDPKCYTSYQPQAELVRYFQKAVELYRPLQSYQVLANKGILPDISKTYALSDIQGALGAAYGFTPVIKCPSGSNAIDQIWVFYNSKGGVASGEMVKTASVGSLTNCPATVRYLPKYTTIPNDPSNPSGPVAGPPTAAGQQGLITPTYSDGTTSAGTAMINSGKWFKGTGGTYTTFATSTAGQYTISTKTGFCGLAAGTKEFACGPYNAQTATAFTFDQDGILSEAATGSDAFSAAQVPAGSVGQSVYANQSKAVQIFLVWANK